MVSFWLCSLALYPDGQPAFAQAGSQPIPYKQWFMGPIITPNPNTVPPGHPGLELELIVSKNYGTYDGRWKLQHSPAIWGIRPLFDFQAGFNSVLGVEVIGSMITNFSQGASYTHLTDTIFRCGFQILTDQQDSWVPDLRVLFQEILPTGHYQKLSTKKYGTDLTGQGSFQSGLQIVSQKLFWSEGKHPFRLRGSAGYFVPAPVSVQGINYYGGDSKTKGKVYPGQYFSGFVYGEYALSRRWAIASELNYQQGAPGRFSKRRGAPIDVPQFVQISILPEIQHTFSENMGVIVGGWFTLAGKNSYAFGNVFCAVLLLF